MELMNATGKLAAVTRCGGDGFASICPELNVARQGDTVEQARGEPR